MNSGAKNIMGPAQSPPLARAPDDQASFSLAQVDITFLRMNAHPATPAPPLQPGYVARAVPMITPELYRDLYYRVGQEHLWWQRRLSLLPELERHLRSRAVHVHVLYRTHMTYPSAVASFTAPAPEEAVGFFELNAPSSSHTYLSLFGLVPEAIGLGLGGAFLRCAVDAAWALGAHNLTVNTNTADHPRALPMYKRAGFVPYHTSTETWRIPRSLGLSIPPQCMVAS